MELLFDNGSLLNILLIQVKKFGDSSRIKLIAKDAGGSIAATTASSQVQLWEALVNGCKDAVSRAGADSKVQGVILYIGGYYFVSWQ